MSDYLTQLKSHLERTDAALDYLDGAIDKAVAITEKATNSTETLRAKSETMLCIFPRAPIAKIIECIAGGGLVTAIIGSRPEWMASAVKGKPGIPSGQIIECSESQATIKFNDNETIIVKNPGEKILFVAMFWVVA